MYKPLVVTLIFVGSFLLPMRATAQVIINEIAWMGTSVSANAEWIELYNTSAAPVSLAGWTLTSAGTAPSISLTGSIAPLGYALLERTSDASVPGVSAHQVYTGALSNSGDTLTLRDGAGAIVDTVVGGSAWSSIGGDNSTKHTPQRTTTGWITGAQTPGVAYQGSATVANDSDTEESVATTSPVVTVQGAVAYALPTTIQIKRLYIDAGPPRVMQTYVPAYFKATAYDSYKSKRKARFIWSFGNGERVEGDEVMYTYRAPGTYTLVVRVHDGKQEGITLIPIEVHESNVSIVEVNNYGVVVENKGTTLIDLSNWLFQFEGHSFVIPPDTVLGSSSRVVFTYETLGIIAPIVTSLHYPTGMVASTWTLPESRMKPKVADDKLSVSEGEHIGLPITTTAYESHIGAPTVRATLDTVGATYSEVATPLIFEELVPGPTTR